MDNPQTALSKRAREYLVSIQTRGWRCSLDEIRKAMDALGKPNIKLKSIHVAGTNGKGSVAAICASILKAAGLKFGLFVSPHLIDLRERITINGQEIPEDRLSELTLETKKTLEEESKPRIELTYFEFLAAIGFSYFVEQGVSSVIAETGLGGRFDATNVLQSDVAVITQIGLDHVEQLGPTISSIASEKAGIIKKGSDVVSSAGHSDAFRVVRERAYNLNCSIMELGKDFEFKNVSADIHGTKFDYQGTRILRRVRTNLLGSHQAENAATAIAACDVFARKEGFEITDEHILTGLQNVNWPGRLEIVSRNPLMILDCGHNPSAARRTLESLDELRIKPGTVVFSASRDKDFQSVASLVFPKADRLVLTRYNSPRALEPEKLAELPEARNKQIVITKKVSEAIEKARAITRRNETILVIGSIFLIGDALSWLRYGKEADFTLAGFRPLDTPKS